MNPPNRIAITGATGHLGQLIVESLLTKVPVSSVVACVRSPEKASIYSAKGVVVRKADYNLPATLEPAFNGIHTLLLISSSEIGKRFPQHQAVITAAKAAGVKLIIYTSLLKADNSPLGLAVEHRRTEAAIHASGIPFVVLRNGWYTENYTASIPSMLQRGVRFGGSGEGLVSIAARADYADAAVAVLTAGAEQPSRVYELAGDNAYTLSQFTAEVARQSGKAIRYQNLPEEEYKAALLKAGFPEPYAALIADSDIGASKGGLFDDSRQLSRLIGRSTTPLADTVAAALKA